MKLKIDSQIEILNIKVHFHFLFVWKSENVFQVTDKKMDFETKANKQQKN